jgi:hypothetical protein
MCQKFCRSVDGGAREVERGGVDQLCRLRGERHEDCTDERRCAEQHAEEQEAASEKHGRKKSVFQPAEAVASDEPQEGNPGKRDEIQPDRYNARIRVQPRARLLGIGRY